MRDDFFWQFDGDHRMLALREKIYVQEEEKRKDTARGNVLVKRRGRW